MDKPIKKENIKNIIAVSSGKGGVGKSFVTGLTAVSLSRKGYRVGILDADITGPSIPKMFGVTGGIQVDENMMIAPAVSSTGIKVMSVNFFLENEDTPVLWRGPILSNFIRQFWDQTTWGDLDYLVIDMPPGTGDVPLTVYQTCLLYTSFHIFGEIPMNHFPKKLLLLQKKKQFFLFLNIA